MESAKATLCKKSLYDFTKEFWDVIIPEKPVWANHIKYICDKLQVAGERVSKRLPKDKDIIINVPPGTSKSTIVSVMFPAWLWTIDPTIKFITSSYSATLSLELSSKSRDIITSEKYKRYFPEVEIKVDASAKSNFKTSKNGARFTTSTGGSITGMHAHITIVDDPQNPELANSEKERERTNSFVNTTLSTRKVDKKISLTITVQQRLHPLDVTGDMIKKGREFEHICLPAELTDKATAPEIYTEGLLDPIRLDRSILDETKSIMGSRSYNAQQNQNPEGDEDSTIKEKWLPIISRKDFDELCKDKKIKVDFYLDTAYTEKTKNDPSAIIAVTKIEQIMYVINCEEVWKEFPELIKFIETFTKANGYNHQSRVKVEPKASGKSVVQMLGKTDINISESEAPTASKLERLISIAPKCEAGKVRVVEGIWNSLFIGQVTQDYPPHDDIRDTFIMAVKDKLIENNNSGTYKNRLGFA